MAQAELQHRQVLNPCVPYDPYGSPIDSEPQFLAGQNVMTSVAAFVERYPGFASSIETAATTFSGTIKRIYLWRKWNGSFIAMFSEVTSNSSKLWKYEIGVDASAVLLWTDSSSTTPFDCVNSNNTLYFGNATSAANMRKWSGSGSTTFLWGIVAPAAAPTLSFSGTGIDSAGGYKYVYTYGNSLTAHESSASAVSLSTGTFTNQGVGIAVTASTDPQVNQIHVYRTTDAGSYDPSKMQEISNSPFANSSTTVIDTTADTALLLSYAPALYVNDPPSPCKGFIWYAGRIVGFLNNVVYYTGFEEVGKGVPEECMTSGQAGNFYKWNAEVFALAPMQDGVAIFTATNIYKIEGDSLDTFRRLTLLGKRGAKNITTVAAVGGTVAWLDTSNTVWLSTDGEIGKGIRTETQNIDHSQASIAMHISGNYHWLLLLDGAGGKLQTYDLDLKQWMPPRIVTASALYSGETASGTVTLLIARNGTKILKMTPSNYNDDGATYSAFVTTNLHNICAPISNFSQQTNPDLFGNLKSVGVETNSVEPLSVKQIVDDDPQLGTFVSLTKNIDGVSKRKQGTYVLDNDYLNASTSDTNPAVARRIALQFNWDAVDSNFKLYGWSLAYKPVGQ